MAIYAGITYKASNSIVFKTTKTIVDKVGYRSFVVSDYPLKVGNGWGARFFLLDRTNVVMNFTPMERADYRVGVPRKKQYKLILNSHDEKFGGKDIVENRETVYKATKGECDKQPFSFAYPLPAYGVAVFEF